MKGSDIKLSVVMSVYNAEDYLEEAITSILNQSHKNFEFIIVNDGSNDQSLDIIKYWLSVDDRIILIDQENKGLTKSLNIAIGKAIGDYCVRQDADDVSMPERFERFIDYVKRNKNVSIYSTPAITINSEGEALRKIPNYFIRNGFRPSMLNYYNSLIHGSLIIKTHVIKQYKYDEGFKFCQEFDLYHRLLRAGLNIHYDNSNISYSLRIHDQQISKVKADPQSDCFRRILETHNLVFYPLNLPNRIRMKLIDVALFLMTRVGFK